MDRVVYEVHHSVGLWQLVLCDGSRYGKTLNHYTEKKPNICKECGHWNGDSCKIGYVTSKDSKACKQGVAIKVMAKRGL